MAERVEVDPGVLEWARQTAGLDYEAAAKKLGISAASLARWEIGELSPTVVQLRKAAKAYKRPLAVLLLPDPPEDFQALRDFRRAVGARGRDWSPELHAEYKRALSQREVFLELAEVAPAAVDPSALELGSDATRNAAAMAAALRELLGVEDLEFDRSQPHDALNAFAASVENLGIIVIHTRGVSTDEMRAFSISEWPFPVIALNGQDWPRARLFSLLHELAHLALNAGGLCDLHEARRRRGDEDETEHFCNEVAAAILMPEEVFIDQAAGIGAEPEWTLDELGALSRVFGASSEAVLLRLIQVGLAPWDLYRQRKPELDREYARARDAAKARQRASEGGPSYYVVKTRDLGHGYVTGVLNAFDARAISSLDVADYLDIRFDQLPRLEDAVRR